MRIEAGDLHDGIPRSGEQEVLGEWEVGEDATQSAVDATFCASSIALGSSVNGAGVAQCLERVGQDSLGDKSFILGEIKDNLRVSMVGLAEVAEHDEPVALDRRCLDGSHVKPIRMADPGEQFVVDAGWLHDQANLRETMETSAITQPLAEPLDVVGLVSGLTPDESGAEVSDRMQQLEADVDSHIEDS
jgi:hypothetical protein